VKRRSFLQTISMGTLGSFALGSSVLASWHDTLNNSPRMPVLFMGHGSPMNAIEENQFVKGFREKAKELPMPQMILCVSAHWVTKGVRVTHAPKPKTIHDFGGFPQALFDVQYPASGSPTLALTTQELLHPQSVVLDDEWGLDHGTWSVLKNMYPKADIPVVQLSIDYHQPLSFHFDLAKKLAALRKKGVLIIGSGNIVHNLRLVDFSKINEVGFGFDWAIEAREFVNEKILLGHFHELLNEDKRQKFLQLAIPTPDHFIPLLYALGLKDERDEISLFNDHLLAGSLSMTSVQIG
jgi:4,5-DOPA dioxygenase extradiol